MLYFLLLSGFSYFFFLLVTIVMMYCWEVSWGGGIFNNSTSSWALSYLSFLVYLFVKSTEVSGGIRYCIYLCFLFCLLFFNVNTYVGLYVCSEILLIPLLVLLLGYGAQIQKVQASFYLIFYSIFCSLPGLWFYLLLGGVVEIFPMESSVVLSGAVFMLIWGFLMKLPLYFLHFWLPLVHVESPTSASVYLAGVMLKLGVWGVCLFLPLLNWSFSFFYIMCVFYGLGFAGVCCVTASDTKVLAAYSSILHMSFLFYLLISSGSLSSASAMFITMGHGYVSSLWFFFLGVFYGYFTTRFQYSTGAMGGLGLFFFFIMSITMLFNAGAPISFSFFGDVLGVIFFASVGYFVLFFVLIYYMISFYYSVVFILSGSKTEGGVYFSSIFFVFVFVLCFSLLNGGVSL